MIAAANLCLWNREYGRTVYTEAQPYATFKFSTLQKVSTPKPLSV